MCVSMYFSGINCSFLTKTEKKINKASRAHRKKKFIFIYIEQSICLACVCALWWWYVYFIFVQCNQNDKDAVCCIWMCSRAISSWYIGHSFGISVRVINEILENVEHERDEREEKSTVK